VGSTNRPQKFHSNIVESIFGAVFVDAKGDLSVCLRLAEKLGLVRYLRRLVNEGVDILHPKNKLGEMAHGRTVEYVVAREDDAKSYSCNVKIGGKDGVKASNGSSEDEVATRAADMAVELLLIQNNMV
jgi:dsRNA-specific ribonuclease